MPDMYSGLDGNVLICTECIEAGHNMVTAMPLVKPTIMG